MDLSSADREPTRNSYRAATVLGRQSWPAPLAARQVGRGATGRNGGQSIHWPATRTRSRTGFSNRAQDFGRLPPAGSGYAADVHHLQGFSGHGRTLTGLARKLAEAIAGDSRRLDTFTRIRHRPFPGGRLPRTPALVPGMAWYLLRELVA